MFNENLTLNQLFIKLLTIINKHRKGLSRTDYFHVGIFSLDKKDLNFSSINIKTDKLNVNLKFDSNIENFTDYDFHVIVKENKTNAFFFKPLKDFYNPKYFKLDNSLKVAYMECQHFHIPSILMINNLNIDLIIEKLK